MPISGAFADGDAVSFGDCYVEVDIQANATWAAIDSWATEITFSGEEIPTTETYPFFGTAVVFTGVKGPGTVTCTIMYTEGSTDAYRNIRDRFESGDSLPFEIRWAPKGSGVGNLRFTTSGGKLISCPPPTGAGDASSANVIQFQVKANNVTNGLIT